MFWRELILLFLTTVVSVHLLPVGPPWAAAINGPKLIRSGIQNVDETGPQNHLEVTNLKSVQKRSVILPSSALDNSNLEDDHDSHANWNHRRSKKSFSPWGGKRSAEGEEALEVPLRRSFQPWGGKRQALLDHPSSWDDRDQGKVVQVRSFNPWGGKRGSHDETLKEEAEKRKFQPWGGKRSVEMLPSNLASYYKRKFQPWGGKRQVLDMDELKRRFNPWAGKRSASDSSFESIGEDNNGHLTSDDSEGEMEELKRGFQPWGGKRSSFQPWGGKRSSFQPWGGKRGSFQPWGGKRASFQPWGGKRAFSAWGGKRADNQITDSELDKRPAFQPWAGKRSNELDNEMVDDLLAELHPEDSLN